MSGWHFSSGAAHRRRKRYVEENKRKIALTKEICERCHVSNPRSKGWTVYKENFWEKEGYVYCPAYRTNISVFYVHPNCWYFLEQKLKQEERKKDWNARKEAMQGLLEKKAMD